MKTYESLDALDDIVRPAVIDLLYRMADDALVMGHRDSQWTGLAPILEEDVAFSSMAQDEMGHAHVYYQMLHKLGEPEPDTTAFLREPRRWKCASLVYLPNNRDWAFCVVRKFLFDAAEMVRLTALTASSLVPLAQLATKLRSEKKYHLMHDRAWVLRLGGAGDPSHTKMQEALDTAYPHALGLFEPSSADETLSQTGIGLRETELGKQWESAVAPVLGEAGLTLPANTKPVYGGRVGRHQNALAGLLDDMQQVYRLDPAAKW